MYILKSFFCEIHKQIKMVTEEVYPKLGDIVLRLRKTAFGQKVFEPSLSSVSQDVDTSVQKLMEGIKRQRNRYLKYKTLFGMLQDFGKDRRHSEDDIKERK